MENNEQLQLILQTAHLAATENRHETLTTEHLLLAVLAYPKFAAQLDDYGIDRNAMIIEVDRFLANNIPHVNSYRESAKQTEAFGRVVRRILAQQHASQPDDNGLPAIYVGIAGETNSHAAYYMMKYGMDRAFYEKLINQPTAPATDEVLDKHTTNLTELARQGKIEPMIGRESEIEQLANVLARKYKRNALMVGDPGTGKSAIANGLALRIVKGDVPDFLKNHELYSLEISSLLAGTKYRGEFEEKVKSVLNRIMERDNAILFIDEAHTMKGAGAGSNSTIDFANMIKPATASGKLKVIAATTWDEYYSHFDKDHALMRRFHRITIDEPDRESTIKIIQGVAKRLESHHGTTISIEAIAAAVDGSIRFIPERKNPDKSIDLLDAVCASLRVNGKDMQVTDKHIVAQIEKTTGIAADKVSGDTHSRMINLEANVKSKLYGQDDAVQTVIDRVCMSFSGIGAKNRPLASFLFTGPSGSGKTETAKLLSEHLSMPLIRYDMSEFAERHTVAGLIGAPPGYVGHGEGAGNGRLITDIRKTPYCILLLDEFEKGHPDVYNILLQLLDDGTVTSASGQKADARNVIVIMTTNLGAAENERAQIGFGTTQRSGEDMKALKEFTKPELRNRIDQIVNFKKLDGLAVKRVVMKFMNELKSMLAEQNVDLTYPEALVDHIAERGFDAQLGARPISRKIDELVKIPISRKIMFERLSGSLHVDVVDGVVKLSSETVVA